MKEQGIALYVEGSSLSAIGRLLGYTPHAAISPHLIAGHYRRRTLPRRAVRPQRLLFPQLVQRGAPPFLTQPKTAAGV